MKIYLFCVRALLALAIWLLFSAMVTA